MFDSHGAAHLLKEVSLSRHTITTCRCVYMLITFISGFKTLLRSRRSNASQHRRLPAAGPDDALSSWPSRYVRAFL